MFISQPSKAGCLLSSNVGRVRAVAVHCVSGGCRERVQRVRVETQVKQNQVFWLNRFTCPATGATKVNSCILVAPNMMGERISYRLPHF